ncbi:structural cement protein Gp24 [Methylobacterium nodulans]|uniref:DUF2190 domain-containing protein n=1 Tax=Methylobacterium nodulans (strain LMG 21967 / CNCM I-2342 / ORS 2060) TaxID=460265 RepID=B8IIU9_METNO|nr:hypothetical protein [Methylobacterium nodulans]ACL61744.1 conserved hypothetical protein [Methylobacterium nodulans ORS 2060]
MPPVQTTYAGAMAPAFEGMVAYMESDGIISRVIETAGGIGFGKAAFQGATDDAIATTGAVFRGVTCTDHFPTLTIAGGAGDLHPKGDTVSVMHRGTVWVRATGAVTAGAPAFVTPAGGFSATASGNTAVPAIFDSSGADGALVMLRLNLP